MAAYTKLGRLHELDVVESGEFRRPLKGEMFLVKGYTQDVVGRCDQNFYSERKILVPRSLAETQEEAALHVTEHVFEYDT